MLKKEGRLSLRVAKDVELSIKDYAKGHNTTVSRLTEEYYVKLLRREHDIEKANEDAEQI